MRCAASRQPPATSRAASSTRRARSSTSSRSPEPTARPRPRGGSRRRSARSAAARASSARSGSASRRRRGGSPALHSTGLTTPDPITLQNALHDFVVRGFAACAIEASSIGIAEHRLAGTRVAVAVFTNFSQDHLDYHGDMRAYWQAKAQLFAWPGLRAAVVNLDDEQGVELAATLAGTGVACWTVSTRDASARLHAAGVAPRRRRGRLRRRRGRRARRPGDAADRRLQRRTTCCA